MTASAQGIDISAYQPVCTPAELRSRDFAFFRATIGTTETDQNFPGNWANAAAAGIVRGAYHELTAAPAAAQAARFTTVLKEHGIRAGDMLAVVASDYTAVTGSDVTVFCDQIAAAFPHCPVLIYSDVSFLPHIPAATAARYPLWIAAYTTAAPADVTPWHAWTFWQWQGSTAPDCDAYNGTAAGLRAWISGYARPAPPVTPPHTLLEDDMTVQIPPGTAGPDTGVSFDGTPWKTVGFLADPSRVGAPRTAVRCAFHLQGKGATWTVIEAVMTADQPKTVVDVPAGCDGVSFHRLDDAPLTLVPDFA